MYVQQVPGRHCEGMATASNVAVPASSTVTYSTAVRLRLGRLPNTTKQQIWRDRQIQAQAYNWGVEDVLEAFYRGATVPNPRNNSKPLTKLRHDTGTEHSLLLQRGGYWSAVTATKKWVKHRRERMYAQRKTRERTDTALSKLDDVVQRHADGCMPGLVAELADAVLLYREHQSQRVALSETSGNVSTHLWATPPDTKLADMGVDDRSAANSAAADTAEAALETFKTAVDRLRAGVTDLEATPAVRDRLRKLTTATKQAVAAEAKADKKLLTHICKGDRRLFRTRRELERCSGPALILFEGCTIRDGILRLPGGTVIPLPTGVNTVEDVLAGQNADGLIWSGAVHIVDVTDLAGKVTRRTLPKHRKYHAHFLCRAEAAAPQPVTKPEHSLGCDWGVVVPLMCSDGTAHNKHADIKQQQANQKRHLETVGLQQSMATKTVGSNRYSKQRRSRQRLVAKNTNVRVNHQRHIAKTVVTTPDVRHVVTEDTKVKNMTASAVGTKSFPTHGSAGKRGLNRSILETAPARQTELIERAGSKHSVATTRVHPAYTSLTCFVCGAFGERETQSLFRCRQCCSYTHADVQAALNVNDAGNPGMYPAYRARGGRDSRRETLEDALGTFQGPVDAEEDVTNKYASTTSDGHIRI